MPVQQTQNNPLAPATAPSADQLLNAYQEKAAALRGEVQTQAADVQQFNPYNQQQDTQQDAQQQHISNMEQFLSPIAMNKYEPNTGYTDKKHNVFLQNLENDPAMKEISDPMMEVLGQLKQGIDGGHISYEDAMNMFADFGDNFIQPTLDKHHGKESASHHSKLHDEAAPETPEIVKRARGSK